MNPALPLAMSAAMFAAAEVLRRVAVRQEREHPGAWHTPRSHEPVERATREQESKR